MIKTPEGRKILILEHISSGPVVNVYGHTEWPKVKTKLLNSYYLCALVEERSLQFSLTFCRFGFQHARNEYFYNMP